MRTNNAQKRLKLLNMWPQPYASWMLWCVCIFSMLTSCKEQDVRLVLRKAKLPEGGRVSTLAMFAQRGQILAATSQGLFLKTSPDAATPWTLTQSTTWPSPWSSTHTPFKQFDTPGQTFTFPHHERMVIMRDVIWLLVQPSQRHAPSLLASEDLGKQWIHIPLPYLYNALPSLKEFGQGRNAQLHRSPTRALSALRLSVHGDHMYLLDSKRIWKLNASLPPTKIRANSWSVLKMTGVNLERTSVRDGLPAVLRHYLPATKNRPYEILTVLSDQLMIYRRHKKRLHNWVLASILPMPDRQLQDTAGDEVYILANDMLYRSHDQAEQWERIRVLDGAQPRLGHTFFLQATPNVLLIGTGRGSILRSEDAGKNWITVHPEDKDERAITALIHHKGTKTIWASSQGQGVWSSQDLGRTWTKNTHALRASRPTAMALSPDQELLLGTDAGLFMLAKVPWDGNWNTMHTMSTHALHVDGLHRLVHSGTATGSVASMEIASTPVRSQSLNITDQTRPLFVPSYMRGSHQDARAIVSILSNDTGDQIRADATHAGALTSTDRGEHWEIRNRPKLIDHILAHAHITSRERVGATTHYMTTRSRHDKLPAQIWRSDDDTQSWHAIRTLRSVSPNEIFKVVSTRPTQINNVWLVREHELEHTQDGHTWTQITGPWQKKEDRIIAARSQGGSILVLCRHGEIFTLYILTERNRAVRKVQSIILEFLNKDEDVDMVQDVLMDERFIYMRTHQNVFVASRHKPQERTTQNTSLTISATLVLMLATIIFGGLKWFEQRSALSMR